MRDNDSVAFSPEAIKKIISHGAVTFYKKGTYIFRDKFACNSVFILLNGKAAIYKLNESGQKRVIFILDEGMLLSELASERFAPSASCNAFEDCTVLVIGRAAFDRLMAQDFELAKMVIEQISHKTRRMYRQLKNAGSVTKVEKRVAAKLWKLCRDYGKKTDGGVLIDIEISSVNLADLIGIRRETVSRSLKILASEGLIISEKRKIIVLDPDKLSNFFKGL